MMSIYGSVIEFGIICWSTSPDSSWRLTTSEICDKIVEFSHQCASITFHTGTGDLSLAWMLLRYTKGRRLVPFSCSSCGWLLFSTNIGVSNQHPAKSGVDLHETSWYSYNHQPLQQPRETFHQWATSYHMLVGIRYWCSEWMCMNPNYRHIGIFDLPAQ